LHNQEDQVFYAPLAPTVSNYMSEERLRPSLLLFDLLLPSLSLSLPSPLPFRRLKDALVSKCFRVHGLEIEAFTRWVSYSHAATRATSNDELVASRHTW
jgi:hypothetical protein